MAVVLVHGSELSSLFQAILQPDPPSALATTEMPPSPLSAAVAEESAKKLRRARKQSFERVLKSLIGRIQTELEKQGGASTATVGAYVAHWGSLLSATKAAAA